MDKKEIVGILKSEGLEIAEETAMAATKAALKLIREITPKFSSGGGFIINAFLDKYEERILAAIDKLDGEQDIE